MGDWTTDELDRIDSVDEMEISWERRDGSTGGPIPIWVVRFGDNLYVRSVNGTSAGWFRGTRARRVGHIRAGGVDRDVTFDDVPPGLTADLDEAYRKKYARYPASLVDSIVSPKAAEAATRVVPA